MNIWLVSLIAVFLPDVSPLVHVGSLADGLRSPARVAVAPDGRVYVTDPWAGKVVWYDAGGALEGSWPIEEGPLGIAAHPDGRVFISLRDTNEVGIYVELNGILVHTGTLDGNGSPVVTFDGPTDIAVDPATGRIYVVDAESDDVYGFESDGSLALKFGIRGEGNGQFMYPSAIAFDAANGHLIVADHDNFRCQVFDTAGVFQRRFGFRMIYLPGGVQEGWMPRTQGLAVDSLGHVYVADALMSAVRILDSDGRHLGKVVTYGSDPGDVRTPCDVALSPDGTRLYVVSTNTSSVEIYETPTWVLSPGGGDDGFDPPGTNWSELDAAGALAPWGTGPLGGCGPRGPQPGFDGPHMNDDATIICGRCHGLTGQPGDDVSTQEGQQALCFSCHSAGGQALDTPLHERDVADPYGTNPDAIDGQGSSHAWGVPAINASADSVGPAAGGEMERYLDDSGNIKCATCHNQHNSDAGAPYLRVSNTGDAMCKECHAPRNEGPGERGTHPVGFAYPAGQGEFPDASAIDPMVLIDGNIECRTCHAVHDADSGGANGGEGDGMLLRAANDDALCQACHSEHPRHDVRGPWQPGCRDCHDVHDPASENLSLVSRLIHGTAVTFEDDDPSGDGLTDFIHSNHDPASYDGLCEVCHEHTAHHRNSADGDHSHYAGQRCTDCHPHSSGFLPTGGSCVDCHSVPQDNGDGVPVGGRRAVVGEFPTSDAHAHYGAELGSDACVVCHDMATHMDGYVDLLDADTGALYRFVEPEDLTADPDLSDFCMSCHDADGATRLANPTDPFGNGNTPPDVATRFMGTLQWNEWYGDECFGEEGTLRAVNSHHDISDADQSFSGAKIECLSCHGSHAAGGTQPLIDPYDPLSPWSSDDNAFCLACHAGGNGPTDPAFPPGVVGPSVALRGLDTCDYQDAPWYVDYRWTHTAHGPDSKRGWEGYSGAPSYIIDCMVCHDPHGSYTPSNPAGNPYMIRDFVDGTSFVDDGYRVGGNWTGPPWETYGTARDVQISITGVTVDWGGPTGLCAVCHADWLPAQHFHDTCTACQTCHGHGQAFGEYDWVSPADDQPCPAKAGEGTGGDPPIHRLAPRVMGSTPPARAAKPLRR